MTAATIPRAVTPLRTVPRVALALLLVGGLVAGVVGVERTTRGPRMVDHVEIVNPSATMVDVHVRGESPGVLHLTVVEARSTQVVRDVLDQGREWVFEFVVVGERAGVVRADRNALERNGWRVTVPDDVVTP